MDQDDRYDLFEDVIARLRFVPMSRADQHAELRRVVKMARDECAQIADDVAGACAIFKEGDGADAGETAASLCAARIRSMAL